MFGADILVTSILEAGAKQRQVYLPEGIRWRNYWTKELTGGGKEITAEAGIDVIPLFIREGRDGETGLAIS